MAPVPMSAANAPLMIDQLFPAYIIERHYPIDVRSNQTTHDKSHRFSRVTSRSVELVISHIKPYQ